MLLLWGYIYRSSCWGVFRDTMYERHIYQSWGFFSWATWIKVSRQLQLYEGLLRVDSWRAITLKVVQTDWMCTVNSISTAKCSWDITPDWEYGNSNGTYGLFIEFFLMITLWTPCPVSCGSVLSAAQWAVGLWRVHMYKGNTRRPVSDEWGWFELSHCGIQNLSGCCRVEVGGSSSSNMKNSCTRVCLHSIGATTLKKYLCTYALLSVVSLPLRNK